LWGIFVSTRIKSFHGNLVHKTNGEEMEALLLIWFTHHDAFELRSLEGIVIVFAGPCLVDIFGRTSLAWA
jgi:hypothetical protein